MKPVIAGLSWAVYVGSWHGFLGVAKHPQWLNPPLYETQPHHLESLDYDPISERLHMSTGNAFIHWEGSKIYRILHSQADRDPGEDNA
jgi:hypothetical protein